MSNNEYRTIREKDHDPGPRRIGEFVPAVLARYGIETNHEPRRSRSARVVFVPMTGDFAVGVSELLAAP